MAMEATPMRNALRLLNTKFRAMSRLRRGLVLAFAGVVCFVVLAQFSRLSPPGSKTVRQSTREAQDRETGTSALEANDGSFRDMDKFMDLSEPMSALLESHRTDGKQVAAALPFATPLIAHTAQ